MDAQRLIRDLSRPGAYPHGADHLEVHQTHISVVFLVGSYAYKVKKPLDLGFLDFTTLDRRLRFCHEEVRLNRRLAPEVYLGVVPIVESEGLLCVDALGEALEYAVKMRRIPARATLLAHLERGEVGERELSRLGRRIAEFHSAAASGPEIDRFGNWETVAGNARENLEQSEDHVGTCVSRRVFARLHDLLEVRLRELRSLIESRAVAHVPRDTHGDLHLEHIYLFPERAPPDDFVIIDCIEFNERFRYADPVADMAFTVMDLKLRGHSDLAEHFADAYFRVANDAAGRDMLPFYVAYRSAVRAKVEGMAALEIEVPAPERLRSLRKAQGHWLMTLSELEEPGRRPCLIVVGGLPGTGKSTLSRELAREAGFQVISSDLVRKELAGLTPDSAAADSLDSGIYTPEWTDRTYSACLERARDLLFEGQRVIVDASFRERTRRGSFLDAARTCGARSLFLHCTATQDIARKRIADRQGDPSDADWTVYLRMAATWQAEERDSALAGRTREVPTDAGPDATLAIALGHLREAGLCG